jgi:hypothetical protein
MDQRRCSSITFIRRYVRSETLLIIGERREKLGSEAQQGTLSRASVFDTYCNYFRLVKAVVGRIPVRMDAIVSS